MKTVFAAFQNSLVAQFAYFGRKTASVDLEIIGQLLSVKGYQKGRRARLFLALSEVTQKFFARCALGGNLQSSVEHDVFSR